MPTREIIIVTPTLAAANNGNWRTARRWARFLSGHYRVRLADRWVHGDEAALIALHARKSAASVATWRAAHPHRPLMLVLTGTDLYGDIARDPAAQRSLALADRLVVLNELGTLQLPADVQDKTAICLQSSSTRRTLDKPSRHLRALMVGHLREEKSPATYFEAARRVAQRPDILLDHIGGALDAGLAQQARELALHCPRYRWLGDLPHADTRARIQAAHVLVHPSRIEGGAQAVIEAITSGTPVLASRIGGNLGLLGADYPGCFAWNDASGLATLLQRARDDTKFLAELRASCAQRAPLFHPERERHTLLTLLASLLEDARRVAA